jgi:flagellar motor switch protein FliG
MSSDSNSIKAPYGGPEAVLELLKVMDEPERMKLLDNLRAKDKNLVSWIEERLFVFKDLVTIEPKSIQLIFREVNLETLALAMRSLEKKDVETLLGFLSKRMQQDLRDQLENSGKRPLKQVQDAQKVILEKAKELESKGKLLLKPV